MCDLAGLISRILMTSGHLQCGRSFLNCCEIQERKRSHLFSFIIISEKEIWGSDLEFCKCNGNGEISNNVV